eukprot:GCRY01001281.1.p1 GENE.GCRY01001281.1~~GCRY01001281.1.p1  ORF type:complete len:801 (-),score=64.18 GCRY01001281.1:3120-5423(-)
MLHKLNSREIDAAVAKYAESFDKVDGSINFLQPQIVSENEKQIWLNACKGKAQGSLSVLSTDQHLLTVPVDDDGNCLFWSMLGALWAANKVPTQGHIVNVQHRFMGLKGVTILRQNFHAFWDKINRLKDNSPLKERLQLLVGLETGTDFSNPEAINPKVTSYLHKMLQPRTWGTSVEMEAFHILYSMDFDVVNVESQRFLDDFGHLQTRASFAHLVYQRPGAENPKSRHGFLLVNSHYSFLYNVADGRPYSRFPSSSPAIPPTSEHTGEFSNTCDCHAVLRKLSGGSQSLPCKTYAEAVRFGCGSQGSNRISVLVSPMPQASCVMNNTQRKTHLSVHVSQRPKTRSGKNCRRLSGNSGSACRPSKFQKVDSCKKPTDGARAVSLQKNFEHTPPRRDDNVNDNDYDYDNDSEYDNANDNDYVRDDNQHDDKEDENEEDYVNDNYDDYVSDYDEDMDDNGSTDGCDSNNDDPKDKDKENEDENNTVQSDSVPIEHIVESSDSILDCDKWIDLGLSPADAKLTAHVVFDIDAIYYASDVAEGFFETPFCPYGLPKRENYRHSRLKLIYQHRELRQQFAFCIGEIFCYPLWAFFLDVPNTSMKHVEHPVVRTFLEKVWWDSFSSLPATALNSAKWFHEECSSSFLNEYLDVTLVTAGKRVPLGEYCSHFCQSVVQKLRANRIRVAFVWAENVGLRESFREKSDVARILHRHSNLQRKWEIYFDLAFSSHFTADNSNKETDSEQRQCVNYSWVSGAWPAFSIKESEYLSHPW